MAREPQVLIDPPNRDNIVKIVGSEAEHLIRALRVNRGKVIKTFDGLGNGWRVQVVSVKRFAVNCKVIESLETEPLPLLRLNVGVGVIKGSRMKIAVEKAAELGAVRFVPLLTDRSDLKTSAKKLDKWRGISLSASKQSGRLTLMKIEEPITLMRLLDELIPEKQLDADDSIHNSHITLAMDNAPTSDTLPDLFSRIRLPAEMTILIGPEGGFTPAEIELFRSRNIKLANLGSRPLRTETAVSVSLGILSNLAVSKFG